MLRQALILKITYDNDEDDDDEEEEKEENVDAGVWCASRKGSSLNWPLRIADTKAIVLI